MKHSAKQRQDHSILNLHPHFPVDKFIHHVHTKKPIKLPVWDTSYLLPVSDGANVIGTGWHWQFDRGVILQHHYIKNNKKLYQAPSRVISSLRRIRTQPPVISVCDRHYQRLSPSAMQATCRLFPSKVFWKGRRGIAGGGVIEGLIITEGGGYLFQIINKLAQMKIQQETLIKLLHI